MTENHPSPLHDAAGSGTAAAVADIKARAENGFTPLHIAAGFKQNPAVIIALVKAGANPKARDEDGKTPWDLAKENFALKGTDAHWRLNDLRF